jgi:hypothetical protein
VRAQHDPDFQPQRCAFSGCTKETEYSLWEKYGQHLRGAHGLTNDEARKYHPNISDNQLTKAPRKKRRFNDPLEAWSEMTLVANIAECDACWITLRGHNRKGRIEYIEIEAGAVDKGQLNCGCLSAP